jgi:citrate lyase subunit beta/citryl-CoA lyase
MLFVPGDQDRMLRKAKDLPTDAVILDLEDGVAATNKTLARTRILEALEAGFPGKLPVFIRPNALATGMLEDDLLATVRPRLTGIVLPKVRSQTDVQMVDRLLRTLEQERGLTVPLVLAVLIETPQAVLHAEELAMSSPRVVALVFGADDLSAEMGLVRTSTSEEVRYPRSQVALVAHATGCEAIDHVFTTINDLEGLTRDCQAGRALGYTGKQLIHPAQLAPANAVYSPDPSQVAWARRIVDAFRETQRGVTVVEGRMVDAPIIAQAERILADAAWIDERTRKSSSN